jgi:Na+/H+ antiporter NhaD/arsenite permease-like protein
MNQVKIRNYKKWHWDRILVSLWMIFVIVWLVFTPNEPSWVSISLIAVTAAFIIFVFGVLMGKESDNYPYN